jgi:hypothetical protein
VQRCDGRTRGGGRGAYNPADHRAPSGNPSLTGDFRSVKGANVVEELAAKAMANDPSLSHAQAINAAARDPACDAGPGAGATHHGPGSECYNNLNSSGRAP